MEGVRIAGAQVFVRRHGGRRAGARLLTGARARSRPGRPAPHGRCFVRRACHGALAVGSSHSRGRSQRGSSHQPSSGPRWLANIAATGGITIATTHMPIGRRDRPRAARLPRPGRRAPMQSPSSRSSDMPPACVHTSSVRPDGPRRSDRAGPTARTARRGRTAPGHQAGPAPGCGSSPGSGGPSRRSPSSDGDRDLGEAALWATTVRSAVPPGTRARTVQVPSAA